MSSVLQAQKPYQRADHFNGADHVDFIPIALATGFGRNSPKPKKWGLRQARAGCTAMRFRGLSHRFCRGRYALSGARVSMNSRVKYWLQGNTIVNFGDSLSDYLASELFLDLETSGPNVHLIGSVISDGFVPPPLDDEASELDEPRVVFWGCGIREPDSLTRQNYKNVELLAVRGPVSASELRLGASTLMSDPALLLPAFYEPRNIKRFSGRRLCVPHFHEKQSDRELLALSGCDLVLRPNIRPSEDAIENFIDALCSASFVLTASLHGAIIAAAYGRPFAFWSTGSLDLPTKWQDTAELFNIPFVLCTNVEDAEAYYSKKVVPNYRRPAAWQLLSRAPFPLKPHALLKVLNYELRTDGTPTEKVEEFLRLFAEQSGHFDRLASSIKERGARQVAALRRETARAREEAERAIGDANIHRSRAADLDAALAAARAEGADRDASFRAEAERMAAQAAALAAELERATGDANVHRSRAADLDAALAAARAEGADRDARFGAETERMAAEAAALAAELERALADANVQRGRAADLDAALAEARAEAAERDARLGAETERLERMAAEAAALAAELERALADANVHRSKAEDLDVALAAARAEAAERDARLGAETERSERMAAEAAALAAELERAMRDANVHRSKAEDLDVALAAARAEAVERDARLGAETERSERMAAEAAALASESRLGAQYADMTRAKLRILEAEKLELLARVGNLFKKASEVRARSITLRLAKVVGLLKRHTHDRMLRDAQAIDAFLAGVEWSRIGAPHPDGRLDRIIAHLANPNISLPDLPFFQAGLYLNQYSDVASSNIRPLVHYVTHGRLESRNIHPLVDTSYYQGRYPEVAALGLSPIEHYIQIGSEKGYNPHPLFDTRWYLRTYPEVAHSKFNPLADYLRSPIRQPHPLFDSKYYTTNYPDVATGGIDPLTHFLVFGAQERRNPNPFFDTSYYLTQNPDVVETGINPLVHYIEKGTSELRDPHPGFDTSYYLSTYPDVGASGTNPLAHYLTVGRMEGRHPNSLVANPKQSAQRDAVLMIDAMYPRPNEDSGSLDQIAFIKMFKTLGYDVYFASAVEFGAQSGPETAVEQAGAVCVRSPEYASINHFLEQRGSELAICFLSRAHFGGQFKDAARLHAPQARIVFNTVDLHHVREKRQAEVTGDVELLRQAEESRTLELRLAKTVDATIVVSHQEKDILARELPGTRITMIPLVRDYGVTSIAPFSSREGVGFIGGFQHKPNLDAVDYLIEEIWPAVLARNPSLKLYIIGSHMPAEMADRIERNVSFVGYVSDLDFWLSNLKMTVAPLRYGAGAKGKVVTSLSHGVPCVATPIASEGMGLIEDHHLLVGHTPDSIADQIVRLHASSELWEQLSASGLALMQAEYSLDSGIDKLRALVAAMGITPPK